MTNHSLPSQRTIALSQTAAALAPLRREHMEQIRLWRNEQLSILRQSSPLSQEDQKRYWNDTLLPMTQESTPSLLLFAIIQEGQLIGYGGLTHIDWNNKRAEISFLLDTKIHEDSELFQTLFSSFLETMETVAFQELLLEKLIAEVFAFRKTIIALLRHSSFEKEGRLAQHVHKQGKAYDSLLFAKRKTRIPPQALLLTSIANKIPLIQAIRDSMGAMGISFHLIGCDSNPACLARSSVDAFWNSPPWAEKGSEETLFSFCKAHHVVALIPTRDFELAFFAKLKPTLTRNNISLLSSPSDTIQICQDKWTFMHFCTQHNLPSIPSYLSLDALPSHNTPFVIKERYSFSPKCLHFFNTKDNVLPLLSSFHTPLFQPKIEGTEYSIDVYRSRKTQEARALVRRRDIVIGTEAYLTTPLRHEALESLTICAAHALRIEGHAVFQAIERDNRSLYFLECNPRIGGASTASFMNGLSSIEWFLQEEILHQPLPPFRQNLPLFPQLRIREDVALVSSPDVYT